MQQVNRQREWPAVVGNAAAPEILDRLQRHLAVVGHRLQRKGQACAERGLGQRTLAETVDREDGGFIEELERLLEQQGQLRAGYLVALLDCLHQFARKRVSRWRGLVGFT